MSSEAPDTLAIARSYARDANLPHGGNVTPADAWRLFQARAAVIVDVRGADERQFVGEVPGSLHVAWTDPATGRPNPDFVGALTRAVGPGKPMLLICRSGERSSAAAAAATRAGVADVFSVLEGFEGDRDAAGRRGRLNGWRFRGLPWEQD